MEQITKKDGNIGKKRRKIIEKKSEIEFKGRWKGWK